MTTLSDQEKMDLGLAVDATTVDLGSAEPDRQGPVGYAALAFSHSEFGDAVLALEARVERALEDPAFERLRLPGLPEDVVLSRDVRDAALVRVDSSRVDLVGVGEWTRRGSAWFGVPARKGVSSLRIPVADGTVHVRLSSNGPPRGIKVIEQGTSSLVQAPALSALLDGLPCPPWLAEAFSSRASAPSEFARMAAVGLLARLWSPPREMRAVLRARAAGGDSTYPHVRAVAWARGNSDAVRVAIEMAVESADELADKLEELLDWLPDDDHDDRVAALLSLVDERDDLASVLYLARWLSAGSELERALTRGDAAARSHWTLLTSELDLRGEPRFVAAREAEPEGWWTELAAEPSE